VTVAKPAAQENLNDPIKAFEEWKWEYDESFKEVEFCIPGHTEKWFVCYIQVHSSKKTWTMIYQNPDNYWDWWIRSEPVSQSLWFYGKPILPQTYNHLFEKIISK
jgi:hypothetical protein